MADVRVRWRQPQEGYIKINVHSFVADEILPNGNRTGIGFVFRNSRGTILRMVAGSMGIEEEDLNGFYSVLMALRRAFFEDYKYIELDIDDAGVYWTWRNSRDNGVHPNHQYVVQQLNQRRGDRNLFLTVRLIDQDANRMAEYLAAYGAHHWTNLVIINGPFGRIAELWRNDMGLGPVAVQFREFREEEMEEVVVNEDEDEIIVDAVEGDDVPMDVNLEDVD